MKGLRKLLIEEYLRLEKIAGKLRKELADMPEGTLRVSKSHNYTQFYHVKKENDMKCQKFLQKSEMDLVRKLAQKSYDEKVLRIAEKRLQQMKSLVGTYHDNEIEEVYKKEHPARKAFVIPVEPTEEQLEMEWYRREYKGKEFQEGVPVIITEKGERVRSKTEKMLADFFYRKEILYRYEKPLYLKGYGIVYPDFTFFSRKKRKEIYWEHEGMMDDPEYARAAIRKIKSYEKNGIYPGENLILTFETQQNVQDFKIIEEMIDRYLQ